MNIFRYVEVIQRYNMQRERARKEQEARKERERKEQEAKTERERKQQEAKGRKVHVLLGALW